MKKSFGRIPTWQMFKESFSPSQENEESSLDDLETSTGEDSTLEPATDEFPADGADTDNADTTDPTDADSEPAAEGDELDKIKTKILDLKDKLENSEDEFTKEDMLKFLDEVSDDLAAEEDGDGTEGVEGEDDGADATDPAEGDQEPAEDGADDTGAEEELSESKKDKKGKLVVPETKKAAKHKKADVTGKPTTPEAAAKPKPSAKK